MEHQTFLGCPENELKKSLGLPATQTLSKEEGSERYYYLEEGYSWEIHSKNRREKKVPVVSRYHWLELIRDT